MVEGKGAHVERKRLAFVGYALGLGGAERDLSKNASSWVAEGHDVSLFIFTDPEEKPFYPIDPSIHVHSLKASISCFSLIQHSSFARWFLYLITLRQALKKLRPHAIIAYVDLTNIITLVASRGLGIPVIVAERTDPFSYKVGFFFEQLRRITYRWARKLVVQTSQAASYFSKNLQARTCVIPNGIRKPSHFCTIRQEVRSLISMGRLDPYKGFDILIESCVTLFTQNPTLRLTIYGEGPYREALEEIIHRHNLTDRIHLPGAIAQVEETLAQADMFLFPSFYEGFPNALCEAMAVGLPVIASHCLGNAAVVREGIDGYLVPVKDVPALTQKMAFLIENPEERLRISKNAQLLPKRFSEEQAHQRWREVITEVTSSWT
ncbi:MAG: glycosyltransferase family 4 protein [Holosporales bacterium]|jgi:glycosyltransferase involved in cell wall biosynthesis|nr:glycosyltransferase family 4 protein [Holosporales bacterium]